MRSIVLGLFFSFLFSRYSVVFFPPPFWCDETKPKAEGKKIASRMMNTAQASHVKLTSEWRISDVNKVKMIAAFHLAHEIESVCNNFTKKPHKKRWIAAFIRGNERQREREWRGMNKTWTEKKSLSFRMIRRVDMHVNLKQKQQVWLPTQQTYTHTNTRDSTCLHRWRSIWWFYPICICRNDMCWYVSHQTT